MSNFNSQVKSIFEQYDRKVQEKNELARLEKARKEAGTKQLCPKLNSVLREFASMDKRLSIQHEFNITDSFPSAKIKLSVQSNQQFELEIKTAIESVDKCEIYSVLNAQKRDIHSGATSDPDLQMKVQAELLNWLMYCLKG